jgi:hypothetical protein
VVCIQYRFSMLSAVTEAAAFPRPLQVDGLTAGSSPPAGGYLDGGNMAYTLGEAARVTGKSKPAISKAIKSGRLSASRADDGSYRIDPAELERVYPVTGSLNGQGRRDETPVDISELTLWRTLATEREATIRDLRARLDASENDRRQIEAERRQLSERLHGLLTVNRAPNDAPAAHNARQTASPATGNASNDAPAPSASSGLAIPRSPWWRRWFR